MRLRTLTRKTKIRLIPAEEDICELLFTHSKTQRACRLFLEWLKKRGECTRSELSRFAWDLEAGKVADDFRYSRTNFYRQIRKVLLTLGLIAIEQRFDEESNDVKEKYVPVRQPIPKRPPDGLNLPRLMWMICKRWNDEFLEKTYSS